MHNAATACSAHRKRFVSNLKQYTVDPRTGSPEDRDFGYDAIRRRKSQVFDYCEAFASYHTQFSPSERLTAATLALEAFNNELVALGQKPITWRRPARDIASFACPSRMVCGPQIRTAQHF